jgi:hypothetical protein
LHDQRCADIGSEHDGQRRNQADQAAAGKGRRHQCGRGAALQQGGDTDTGKKGREARF